MTEAEVYNKNNKMLKAKLDEVKELTPEQRKSMSKSEIEEHDDHV